MSKKEEKKEENVYPLMLYKGEVMPADKPQPIGSTVVVHNAKEEKEYTEAGFKRAR